MQLNKSLFQPTHADQHPNVHIFLFFFHLLRLFCWFLHVFIFAKRVIWLDSRSIHASISIHLHIHCTAQSICLCDACTLFEYMHTKFQHEAANRNCKLMVDDCVRRDRTVHSSYLCTQEYEMRCILLALIYLPNTKTKQRPQDVHVPCVNIFVYIGCEHESWLTIDSLAFSWLIDVCIHVMAIVIMISDFGCCFRSRYRHNLFCDYSLCILMMVSYKQLTACSAIDWSFMTFCFIHMLNTK